jgi:hypothetical protein
MTEMTATEATTPGSAVDAENVQVATGVEMAPVKPRRPHRRTRPLPAPEPVLTEPVPEAPQLPQPPGYLVSIAQSRRERERRLLVLDIERCDREIASRTMQLRLNCAPVWEVERVEQQLRQARNDKAARIKAAAALSDRDLALHYVPENKGWAG